jgi:hypothetical protein
MTDAAVVVRRSREEQQQMEREQTDEHRMEAQPSPLHVHDGDDILSGLAQWGLLDWGHITPVSPYNIWSIPYHFIASLNAAASTEPALPLNSPPSGPSCRCDVSFPCWVFRLLSSTELPP